MEPTDRELWAERVERWQESGLTAKEFAAEAGISFQGLGKWRWRLETEKRKREEASRGGAEARKPVEFIELVGPRHKGDPKDRFEVVFSGGATLRVPPKFDPEALKQLVAVLGR